MKKAFIYAGLLVGAASLVALPLHAAPPPGKGKPPVEEETGNNLSYAGKFVPSTVGAPSLRLTCLDQLQPPDATDPKCTDFPDYWCQKTAATWQAACVTAMTAIVNANWGANLVGDGVLKAGKPIRVEMGLVDATSPLQTRIIVTNLTPDLEDRFATYGTNGATTSDTSYSVFDAGATLKIETCNTSECLVPTGVVLPEGPMSAEINSLGNIVYGYNWGTKGRTNAPAPGTYKLTFCANNTQILGANSPKPVEDNCTSVVKTLTVGGRGGR